MVSGLNFFDFSLWENFLKALIPSLAIIFPEHPLPYMINSQMDISFKFNVFKRQSFDLNFVLFGPIVRNLFQSIVVYNSANDVNFALVKVINLFFCVSRQINQILDFECCRYVLWKNVDTPFESIVLLVHEGLPVF